ncbi:hypothetical protein FE783_21800 [Paenibacillus mesophilus]|uniref:hypothetical protein n=1 Tax=Paenibacillus mesophilus TaxID=2582849 RepID=UPI00110F3EEE|nr:hypothetical protein [Paenibacillus mesophilus]TMV47626.1 hypothetical protein FE783_21800 [Paenibacillus mesophilus]
MLKIRLKVKHLVLSIAAAGAFVPLLTGVIVPQSELYLTRKQAAAEDFRGREAIREAIDGSWITDKQKWRLIRDYMIDYTPDKPRASDFDLYAGPGFTQMHHNGKENLFGSAEKIPYLESYVARAPVDGYWLGAAKHLAYCYMLGGETERAIAALEQAAKRLSGERYANMHHELAMRAAEIAGDAGRLEKAETMLAELTSRLGGGETQWNDKIAELRARLIVRGGDLQQSLKRVQAELDEMQKRQSSQGDRIRLEQSIRLRERLVLEADRQAASASSVSGAVKRSDGTPLSRTGVYLREARIVNQSVSENDPYQAVTDENGRFAFDSVVPGSYQLYLGLDFDQISGWTWPVGLDDWIDVDGRNDVELPVSLQPLIEQQSPVNQTTVTGPTIDFQWRKVEGAAYYNVNVGIEIRQGTGSTSLRTHVTENRLRIPVEQLYDQQFGLSYEKAGEWSTIDPATILGFADPGTRFFWSVEAYDGNDKLITRSNGYRLDDDSIGNLPFFFVRQRTMTDADKLTAEGRFEEALAAYRKAFADDPGDIHALRMTSRLLFAKAAVTGDRSFADEAHPYLAKLAELYPRPGYASQLMHYYYEKRDWSAFNGMYALYTRLSEQPLSSYETSIYATALMKQGKYAEALIPFEKALKADGSHRFIGNYISALLYVERSAESALQMAEAYPERSFGPPTRDWRQLVASLRAEADGAASYFEELNGKLDLHFRGQTDDLRSWLASTDKAAMKAFIQAVMGVH